MTYIYTMNKLARYTIILFCIAAFYSCHPDKSTSNKTAFNLNLDEGLTSLDPAFCRNKNTILMDNQIYNGLVQIDDSLRVMPCNYLKL